MSHHVLMRTAGNQVPINYLSRTNPAKLKLIQGDTDAFADVIALINEYEGTVHFLSAAADVNR
jgi:hypothetical protein